MEGRGQLAGVLVGTVLAVLEEALVAESPRVRVEVGGEEGSRSRSVIHFKRYTYQQSPKRESIPDVPKLIRQQTPFCLQIILQGMLLQGLCL